MGSSLLNGVKKLGKAIGKASVKAAKWVANNPEKVKALLENIKLGMDIVKAMKKSGAPEEATPSAEELAKINPEKKKALDSFLEDTDEDTDEEEEGPQPPKPPKRARRGYVAEGEKPQLTPHPPPAEARKGYTLTPPPPPPEALRTHHQLTPPPPPQQAYPHPPPPPPQATHIYIGAPPVPPKNAGYRPRGLPPPRYRRRGGGLII